METVTEKQRTEMLEAAKPLIRWLNENCNPHCQAVVDRISVLVMEGVAMNRTQEFPKGLNDVVD